MRAPLVGHIRAVYALDVAFADNPRGASYASASRIGAALGLHERTVRRVRRLLAELRLLGREERPGHTALYWPVIPRALARPGLSLAWWLDATSDRPGVTPDTYTCPGSVGTTPDTTTAHPGHDGGVTPDATGGDPGHEGDTTGSGIKGLAQPDSVSHLSHEERARAARALSSDARARGALAAPAPLPLADSIDDQVRAWAAERRPPTPEERARVTALARAHASQQREADRLSRDPDAGARAMAASERLRARGGIGPEHLEEALANLRRLRGEGA